MLHASHVRWGAAKIEPENDVVLPRMPDSERPVVASASIITWTPRHGL